MPVKATGLVTDVPSFRHSRLVVEGVEVPAVKAREDCVVLT
jgi:hypothetical protein